MKEPDMNKYFDIDERREEARLNLGAEIFIETVSSEPGDARPAEVIRCEAVDLSANGLQVLVDSKLTDGAIHTLIVDMDQRDDVFRLTAEVRWVRPHSDGFLTGLLLYESDGTEIVDWKLTVAKYLN